MAFGLVAASCNNDKGKNDRGNRERDDYRNNDRDRDDNGNRDNDDQDRDEDYSSGGWSSSEKRQWSKMCVDPLVESLGETKAEKYCDCVLDKIMEKYPSFEKMNRLGSEEAGMELGKELGMACMSELLK